MIMLRPKAVITWRGGERRSNRVSGKIFVLLSRRASSCVENLEEAEERGGAAHALHAERVLRGAVGEILCGAEDAIHEDKYEAAEREVAD